MEYRSSRGLGSFTQMLEIVDDLNYCNREGKELDRLIEEELTNKKKLDYEKEN
jgi:hypothetical protein